MSDELQAALSRSDSIGWDAFYFGAVAYQWGQIQEEYIREYDKLTSRFAWMIMIVRKVWNLQRRMWGHRNKFVHKGSRSLHEYGLEAVNDALQCEFAIGRDELLAKDVGLFHGYLIKLVDKNASSKLQWLYSIWIPQG